VLIALVLESSKDSVKPTRISWGDNAWRHLGPIAPTPRRRLAKVLDGRLDGGLEALPFLVETVPRVGPVSRHDEDPDIAALPRQSRLYASMLGEAPAAAPRECLRQAEQLCASGPTRGSWSSLSMLTLD
jgi:hypothetical protein